MGKFSEPLTNAARIFRVGQCNPRTQLPGRYLQINEEMNLAEDRELQRMALRVRQDPRSKNMNQNVYWRLLYLEPKTCALGMLRETLQKRGDMPAGVWGKSQEASMVPSDLKCLGLLQKAYPPPHSGCLREEGKGHRSLHLSQGSYRSTDSGVSSHSADGRSEATKR